MTGNTMRLQTNSTYHLTEKQIVSENDMVEAAKKNPQRFGALYNKYYEPIFRFVFQRTGDEDQAHEVTSEVFFKALSNIHKYEFRGLPFSSWLFRIAQNEVYKSFRANNKDRVVKVKTEHLNNLAEEIEEGTDQSTIQQVLSQVKNLKDDEIQLIEMRFFEQRPFKEIAEIFDKKESAIKMKLYRTLEKIKSKVTRD